MTFFAPQTLLLTIFASFSLNALAFNIDQHATDISQACVEKSSYEEKVKCINTRTEDLIRKEIDGYFREDLREYADAHGLVKFDPQTIANIYDLYPISIPTKDEYEQPLQCFDLTTDLGIKSVTKLKQITTTMLMTSLFIKKFSTYSLGKPFSVLLKFNKVNVCGSNVFDRRMRLNRAQLSLDIGIRFKLIGHKLVTAFGVGEEPISPDQLWKTWQSGDAINPRMDSYRWKLLQKLNFAGIEQDEVFDELLYQKWSKVNPVGDIRNLVRVLAFQFAYGTLDSVVGPAPSDAVRNILEGSEEKIDVEALATTADESLMSEVQNTITNPQFISKVLAKHLSLSAKTCSGAKTTTVLNRNIEGGFVNVTNAKSGALNVNFDFPYPEYEEISQEIYIDQSNLCAESHLVNNYTSSGFINVDLVDNGSVSVAGLSKLGEALSFLPKLALLEVAKKKKLLQR